MSAPASSAHSASFSVSMPSTQTSAPAWCSTETMPENMWRTRASVPMRRVISRSIFTMFGRSRQMRSKFE